MPDTLALVKAVSMPMLKVLSTCVIGAVCSTKRVGLLRPATRAALSKLNVNVFLPPFLFVTLSKGINMNSLSIWWPIPLFVLFNVLIGLLMGYILVWTLGNRVTQHRGLVMAACSCGNFGQLPLALVSAACQDGLDKFQQHAASCAQDSQAMVAFGLWIGSITIWTIGQHLTKPAAAPRPAGGGKDVGVYLEMGEEPPSDDPSPPTRLNGRCGGDGYAGGANGHAHGGGAGGAANGHAHAPAAGRPGFPAKAAAAAAKQLRGALSFVNLPICAVGAGLTVGTVGGLRWLLVGKGAPLWVVSDTLGMLGDAMIPTMLLILGANMAPSEEEGMPSGADDTPCPLAIAGVTVVRLLLLPAVGMGLVAALLHLQLMPLDPLMHFVILLQFTTPTAANLGTVVTLHGQGQRAATAVAVPQYLAAIPLVSLAMLLYLSLPPPAAALHNHHPRHFRRRLRPAGNVCRVGRPAATVSSRLLAAAAAAAAATSGGGRQVLRRRPPRNPRPAPARPQARTQGRRRPDCPCGPGRRSTAAGGTPARVATGRGADSQR